MGKFLTSVRLNKDLCKGCINCIKRCPTQAIRVRNDKAVIKNEFCIDCGECIRICPYHAKEAVYDNIKMIKDYKYKVALPAPSLYAQFNNLDDINILLTAIIKMGFDDVFEVGSAAELVSEVSRNYVRDNKNKWPIINTACPSVVRLIQVRFPNLIEHLLPIAAPVEIAAKMAREKAMKDTGLPSEEIGLFFMTPCPAKVTAIKSPTGMEQSEIDVVLAIKDIYPILLPLMKESVDDIKDLRTIGRIGISWGGSGGEASGLLIDNYLAADGIENVIRVLEDLEDEKFQDLEFIELNACAGGCVGGVLTVENPYVAKVKLKRLRKYMPIANNHMEDRENKELYWTKEVEYQPVFKIGNDLKDSIKKMAIIEELYEKFPKLDCGSCGAPTCKALAEDIVRGEAREQDCIHILREYIHKISDELTEIDYRKG